ncbi:MAG TPA: ADP-glyceromanno-heptose 6-epimerase [Stellaceae bacterium]|nr:ADP-glyceromanno-heptose 6-epimerase [Stellaceae bacterium]
MLVVTGGGGFIGSALVWALNEAGHADIVIVDRFGHDGKWRNIAKRDFFEIVAIDKLPAWLDRFGHEVEAVFHLGANASTTETDADLIIDTNLNASIALWRWCAAHAKKLIYASSAATYGDGTQGFDDAGGLAELKRLRPMNLYGWSKHAFDLWALREAAKGHAPPLWLGLKFFNVFGPNEYHKGDMQSLVAKDYAKIAAGEPIRLFKSHRPDYADGEQKRDFVYVKDVVQAVLWLWRQATASGIHNFGTGVARSFRELMEATGAACGKPAKIEYVDTPPAIRSSYQYLTEAKMDWLHAAGYNAPLMPLETAVEDFVTGYLARPDPYL